MASPVFSIQITRFDDRYKVITIQSPVGQPESRFDPIYVGTNQKEAVSLALEAASYIPGNWDNAVELFQALKDLNLASDDGFRADMHEHIGRDLFAALFSDSKLIEALHSVLNASSSEDPARIELRFSEEAVDLATYPWELLYEPERNFLFQSPSAGLVRYITCSLPSPKLLEAERLRLLLISARPVDAMLQQLPGTEKDVISDAQANSLREDSIQVDFLRKAGPQKSTWDLLNEWLINHRGENAPHIFHFDGHGGYGKLCQCGVLNRATSERCWLSDHHLDDAPQGYLAFEKTDHSPDWISARKLANLLNGAGVRLAVLSACKSAVMSGKSVFSGMAPALIQAGIPAMVAMQFSIAADSAERFIKAFYQSLSNGDSLVSAVNQARAGLIIDQTAWYRPVLYLRTDESNPDGRMLSGKREEIRSPNSYIKLTRKVGINQREAVTMFADMVLPGFQTKNKHMLVIEAPPLSGKSTAIAKFKLICDDQASKQHLAYIAYDLDSGLAAPITLAKNIVNYLAINAGTNPNLTHRVEGWKEKAGSLSPISSGKKPAQKNDQETEWNDLAQNLYDVLEQITNDIFVVLMFDGFQKIADSASGIWLKNHFLQNFKNRQIIKKNAKLVVVIAGDRGLIDLKDWPGVEFLDVINDVDIEDIQWLARENYGISNLSQSRAESFWKKAKGDMSKLNDFLWSYSEGLKEKLQA